MRDTNHFLVRLGVRADAAADVRSIRRAYARELKEIDQVKDAAGFQSLREAYEAALAWAGRQADAHLQAETPAPEPVMPPQPPAPAPFVPEATSSPDPALLAEPDPQPEQPDPQAWADHAFQQLLARCAILVQGPQCHDDAAWQEALRQRLDDPALFNMAARGMFEARVADLLGQGWRRGHDMLLLAAVTVFDWAHDRRRLLRFGRAGALIDRGIDEENMFASQPDDEKAAQRLLMARLRDARPATVEELQRERVHFERLDSRYPAMMILLVGAANVERWAARLQYLPRQAAAPVAVPNYAQAPRPRAVTVAPPARTRWWRWFGGRVLGVLLVVSLLRLVFYALEPAETPVPRSPQQAQEEVLSRTTTLDLIRRRVAHVPIVRDDDDWKRPVVYRVYLDERGKVHALYKVEPSADARYDAEVALAIRSVLFPQGTPRIFRLQFPVVATDQPEWLN